MAKRRLGQHFLVDKRAPGRIVRALGITEDRPVLEIGPGRGALTAPLIQAAGRIAAVEVDGVLAEQLRSRFDETKLHLVVGDVLRLDLADVLAGADFPDNRILVTGNLPYYISKPIVQQILKERDRVERAVLMFQREVAQRLTARPGSRNFGPLTVLATLCFEIETLFHLPPRAFAPPPKVESTVTRWRRRQDCLLDEDLERRLRRVLTVSFSSRRRTLRNNLKGALTEDRAVDDLLDSAGLDGTLRAEALSVDDFLRLAKAYPSSAD